MKTSTVSLIRVQVDPQHAAGLQFGATSGLLSSDASVLRGRPASRFPTLHQMAKVPDVGS